MTLLRLSGANAIAIVVQIINSLFDALVAGRLGTIPLESVSFVVPAVLLMHGVAATGYGGGISSAVARSLGEGDRVRVAAVAGNGLVLGVILGTLWGGAMLLLAPSLYRAMGASSEVLVVALGYSNIVFALAPVSWLFYGLVAIVRGSGKMAFPALIVVLGSVWYAGVSLLLVFVSSSPLRGSMRGVALAFVLYQCLGAAVLLLYIWSGRSRVVLSRNALRIDPRALGDVLRVGFPSGLNSIQAQAVALVVLACLGAADARAAAGYGIAWRLEQVHVALAFGVGLALVAMVGANVGAGNLARARRIAWTGACLTAAITGVLGLSMAATPRAWISIFTSDADLVRYASEYLSVAGPSHLFFGLGLALYYASQGAGHVTVPLLAGTIRLGVAAAGCWAASLYAGGSVLTAFLFVAASFVVYGASVGLWCLRRSWPAPRVPTSP